MMVNTDIAMLAERQQASVLLIMQVLSILHDNLPDAFSQNLRAQRLAVQKIRAGRPGGGQHSRVPELALEILETVAAGNPEIARND